MKSSIPKPTAMASVILLSSLFHSNPALADGCPAPSFAAARIIDVGSGVVSVAIGDFNGDGKPDLGVAKNFCSPEGPCTTNGSVSVVLGNGDGTFQAPMDYRVGTNPVSLVMGDINGDGKPDLAVLSYGSSGVSLLFGKGDGTFQDAVNYGTGNGASSVAIGDFNGDGKADLAVASDGVIAVLLGNGDGTFQAAVNYGAGANPWSVVVSDFNGDGKSDLAVADRGTVKTVGNGAGLFGRGVGSVQRAIHLGGGGYCGAG